ncbi:hypothetical protein H8E07_16420 [bacterium]|nr:hypothetical protein [bacterium]
MSGVIRIFIFIILSSAMSARATVFGLALPEGTPEGCTVGRVRTLLVVDGTGQDLIMQPFIRAPRRFALVMSAPAPATIGTADFRLLPALDFATNLRVLQEFCPPRPSDHHVNWAFPRNAPWPPPFALRLDASGDFPSPSEADLHLSRLGLYLSGETREHLIEVSDREPRIIVLVYEAPEWSGTAEDISNNPDLCQPVRLTLRPEHPWLPVRGGFTSEGTGTATGYVLAPRPHNVDDPGAFQWLAHPFGPNATQAFLVLRDVGNRALDLPEVDPLEVLAELGRDWLRPGACSLTRIICRDEMLSERNTWTLSPSPYVPDLAAADPCELTRAVLHLALEEDTRYAADLHGLLDDPEASPVAVAAAALGLGGCGRPADVPALVTLSDHEDASLRLEAQQALIRLDPATAQRALARELVRVHSNVHSRQRRAYHYQASRQLGRICTPDILPYLGELASTLEPGPRAWQRLRYARAMCGDEMVAQVLIDEALAEPDPRATVVVRRVNESDQAFRDRFHRARPCPFNPEESAWPALAHLVHECRSRPGRADELLHDTLARSDVSDVRRIACLQLLDAPTDEDRTRLLEILDRTRIIRFDRSRPGGRRGRHGAPVRYDAADLTALSLLGRYGLTDRLLSAYARHRDGDPVIRGVLVRAMAATENPAYLAALQNHALTAWVRYARSREGWREFEFEGGRRRNYPSPIYGPYLMAFDPVARYLEGVAPGWLAQTFVLDPGTPPILRDRFRHKRLDPDEREAARFERMERLRLELLDLETGHECWRPLLNNRHESFGHIGSVRVARERLIERYLGSSPSKQ